MSTIFTTTRAQAELAMLRRNKKFMVNADMDVVTQDGTNKDLEEPYESALRWMGLPDVSGLTDQDSEAEFLDVMQLQLLANVQANYDLVDTRVGERFTAFNNLAVRMRQRYKDLLEFAKETYGFGERQMVIGVMQTDINETPEA